jgi:hypothetical protein
MQFRGPLEPQAVLIGNPTPAVLPLRATGSDIPEKL